MMNIIKTILVVVFGCNVDFLLEDRVDAGVNYALTQDNETVVHWLLSGGVKNPMESSVTEAVKMTEVISRRNNEERRKWTYILDEDSTNTAENLVKVKAWISNLNQSYHQIVFVTSAFHKQRASIIANEIFEGEISYDWVLSPMELPDSRYWEGVHTQNARKDARNAKSKCSGSSINLLSI
jgi:hypothetical protein